MLILLLILCSAFLISAQESAKDFTPVDEVSTVPEEGYFISKETALKIAARNIEYTKLKSLMGDLEEVLEGQNSTLQEEIALLNEVNDLLEQKYELEKSYRLEIQEENNRLSRNNKILGFTTTIGLCIGIGLGVGIWAYSTLSP